jgi:hypothetical protein
VTIDKDLSSARVMQIRPSDHPTREFEVPDRVRTLMQEAASSLGRGQQCEVVCEPMGRGFDTRHALTGSLAERHEQSRLR